MGGFWGTTIIFFSSLDGRKEAKEDQGLTEAGEAGRVPGQTSLAAAAAPLPRPGKFGPGTRTKLAGGRSRPATEAEEVWAGYFFSLMIISEETLEGGADARRPRPKAKGVYMSI